jgi:hypothetical protein
MIASAGQQAEQMRSVFSSPDAKAAIERSLLTRKTLDRLAEIVSQDGNVKAGRKKKAAKGKKAEEPKEDA